MNRAVLTILLLACASGAFAQLTYYWVGGTSPTTITTGSNWNTALDGTGSSRPSATGASDILVFDGSNIGGTSPATGQVTVPVNGGVTCAQLKFINNAQIIFLRTTTGTGTINVAGEAGEDFVIESGSSLSFTSTVGSVVIAMVATATGRVSGALRMVTSLQARIANTTSGSPGSLVFTSGSSFTTNITSASSAYGFGGNTQSSEKWVVFQAGSHLYYEGGFSPMGNNAAFSAIDFRPGSTWHHRANNPLTGFGSFFNRKSFANIFVENGAKLSADGPIYRIDSLVLNLGCSFNTHTAGQTVVLKDMVIDGILSSFPLGTHELVLAGTSSQKISGTGIISVNNLVVADGAEVVLQKGIEVENKVQLYGKTNFTGIQLTGTASSNAVGIRDGVSVSGNLTAGQFHLTGNSGIGSEHIGWRLNGPGVAPGTSIVALSLTSDTVFLSAPLLATATGSTLSVGTQGAVLETAHANGLGSVAGSLAITGQQNFESGINYIINGPSTTPFGLTTGLGYPRVIAGRVTVNADITTSAPLYIVEQLSMTNARLTIRSQDTVHLSEGAILSGNFSSTNYLVTEVNTSSGNQGQLRMDQLTGSQVLPVGTATYYLPIQVQQAATSDITASVFEGITADGTPGGTPLTAQQKLTKVNAVWTLGSPGGSGILQLHIQWVPLLEGTTFASLPDSDIGIIRNQAGTWSLPLAPGNNTSNTATATISSTGVFGIGAKPPAQPFTFNALPPKNYGDPDFNGGAISLNTSVPITYSSSNPSVATIVGNNIHITGAGNTDITASQASDGFYPAASVTRQLTVNKAPLTITADDKTKPQGDPNPPLTVTYSGFVNSETSAVLTAPVSVTTTATTASPAGVYPIIPAGASAANYTITFVNGSLTVTPRQNQTITFNAIPAKTYGNADFAAGASSTNNTIPITYTSSNPAVATISGSNIHITGAGTTTITASQAGSALFFAAPDVSRTLTVSKANLTIRAADTVRNFGAVNPDFRLIYTGFVLNEGPSALSNQPVAGTIATTSFAPGYYAIVPSGATSGNYDFTYVNGRLTILPPTGDAVPYLQVFRSNPQVITVRVYSPVPDLGDLYLYDLGGRLIAKRNVFIADGFLNYELSAVIPASGMYVVKVVGRTLNLKAQIVLMR